MNPENLRRRDLNFENMELLCRGVKTGWKLVPSEKHEAMYLIEFDDGTLSYSSYNLTRAKDNIQEYYLEYARMPQK
jgi:predicted Ser/Thr protein kinase